MNQVDDEPVTRVQLPEWFAARERPDPADHLVGTELENFGLVRTDAGLQAISYQDHVRPVFTALVAEFGWRPGADRGTGGEIIALEREGASITLEPGGQLELSGAPLPHVHATCEEFTRHHHELDQTARPLGITWLSVGFHPLLRLQDIHRMPKGRYEVMRAYLPGRGDRALDMMHRTCTVQANFDYASERECGERLRLATGICALTTALFANSPYLEGRESGRMSERSQVWTAVDPDRCGLHPFVFADPASFAYERYVEWALAVPMFFIKRGGRFIAHHRPFAHYLEHGLTDERGVRHRATKADWKLHINTLFPEVRLNPHIEVRGCDAVGSKHICALPALWKGALYDPQAAAEAWELVAGLEFGERLDLWAECRDHGLGSGRVRELCRRLLAIARGGLARQDVRDAKGRSEARFLDALDELVALGASPAAIARDRIRERAAAGEDFALAVADTFRFAGC